MDFPYYRLGFRDQGDLERVYDGFVEGVWRVKGLEFRIRGSEFGV